jgi:hypothetical protein
MPVPDRSAPQHERALALACVVRWPVPDRLEALLGVEGESDVVGVESSPRSEPQTARSSLAYKT